MELQNGILQLEGLLSVTIGILVLFVGKRVNDTVGYLREISIPEPVTGGLIFSLLIALLYFASGTTSCRRSWCDTPTMRPCHAPPICPT